MPRLSLRFLGPPLIELDGQPVHLGRHKAVALLAYLALTRQPHSRDALATLLWPELDQSHARGQLRRTLSLLNRTLGRAWLDVDRETVAWAGDAEAWVDVAALREHLVACVGHGHPVEQACAKCVPLLEEAADLYRDDFFVGFTLPDAPAFDEWQFFEGEGLREGVSGALQQLARWYGDHGEYEAAIPHARRWLVLDPLHESAHRELMALYARSGQRAAALRQYGECERVLQEELGVPPSPETVALYERIRDGQDLSGLPNLTGLRALLPHNLPEQLTPFVGRENELVELSELLSPTAETRLVTVVGPGGMGKTRLALEAASRQLDGYADGVWLVSLAPVQSVEAIASTVAQALGVSFFGPDPPRQQLLRYLREKRMLLVLDNIDHLLEGVDLPVEILRTAPGVRLLVTSRMRLNARGEQVLVLHGMSYPEPRDGKPLAEEVRCYDSVALFARNARRAHSTFELTEENLPHVARICQLAQGMPLAILLAAAWVPALTPAEIAEEMERSLDFLAAEWRDEPERHHSMRAVFDATWGMLSEDERAVFARLSVFRGGFMREAAEAVAGTDLRTLISLVSKSLLQRDRSGRYEIHELLWQYAESRLEEVPEEKENTLDLHAAFCAEFLAREEMDIWRGYMGASLREIDNIRAAWRRMTAHGHVAEIRKCLFSLFGLYQGPGLLQEGEDVFARAVEALRPRPGEELDEGQAAALGLALGLQGRSCRMVGRIDSARPLAQESLSVLSKLGERREVAFAYVLGDPTLDLAGYIRSLEKSLKISSKRAYYPVMSVALTSLMFGAFMRGQDREVERYAQQQLALDKRFGGRWSAAFAHTWLGHVAFAREDYVQARRCYREGLALFRQVGQIWAVGRLYSHLGDVAMAVSDYGEAKACHQRALARCQEVGVYWLAEGTAVGGAWGVPVSHQRLGDVALAQGDLAEAERCYGLALEAASDRPEGGLKPHVLLGPAALLARTGEMQRAAELAVLARHHPASVEETRTKAEELLDRLRSELSPEAYTAAETRGRARDLEATMHELLGKLHA